METVTIMPQVHIRYDGRSYTVPASDLDIGVYSTDEQVRAAVATHLGVPSAKLFSFAIDRNQDNGSLTLRPEAVFG